jgi:hypothetical protein
MLSSDYPHINTFIRSCYSLRLALELPLSWPLTDRRMHESIRRWVSLIFTFKDSGQEKDQILSRFICAIYEMLIAGLRRRPNELDELLLYAHRRNDRFWHTQPIFSTYIVAHSPYVRVEMVS